MFSCLTFSMIVLVWLQITSNSFGHQIRMTSPSVCLDLPPVTLSEVAEPVFQMLGWGKGLQRKGLEERNRRFLGNVLIWVNLYGKSTMTVDHFAGETILHYTDPVVKVGHSIPQKNRPPLHLENPTGIQGGFLKRYGNVGVFYTWQ